MATALTSTKTVVARIPYLNCAPFFHGWTSAEWTWADGSPRRLGQEAEAGRVAAGPMALADFLRLGPAFERLGALGVAVRGRCESVMLFSKRPVRQLDGAVIGVTDDTSTSALLLRLLLEQRYKLAPASYARGGTAGDDNDALLLIGDEALKFRHANRLYPYETDLAFEWWLWQHLPMVFAVWTVRVDAPAEFKQHVSRSLQKQLAVNLARLKTIAEEQAPALGLPAPHLAAYLENFVYRFGALEEQAITQFSHVLHEHHLL